MKLLTPVKVLALTLALQVTHAAQAASLVLEGNVLSGATGVNVGGSLYDVAFTDGSCVSVFGGCATNANIAFNSLASANLAAQALLDQVFVGTFDSNPGLTKGCTNVLQCYTYIPYNVSPFISASVAANFSDASDFIGTTELSNDTQLSLNQSVTWAKFTPSAAAVPEPSTWGMMLIGLGLIGAFLRSRPRGRMRGNMLAA